MGTNERRSTAKRDTLLVAVLLVVGVGLFASLATRPSEKDAGRAPATGASASPSGTPAEDAGPLTSVARRAPDDPLAVGRPDAPVTMVVYSDFRCPFCAKFGRDIEPELIERYVGKGTLRIEWRDFPIFGEQSVNAAKAARAAGAQGRYREFTAALFAAAPDSGHPNLTAAVLRKFAEKAGVPDLARFDADMASARFDEAIEKDMIEGQAIGVPSTPAFLINGRPLLGAQPVEEFTAMVDEAAARG
ncbi:DsbA family protein [Microtetraspora niveoalba]|uniref:DsbA family protein n=1 Tax=Microtetraspora niveoalba TaxID=46175 RepID=UPI00082E8EFC|nr:thioredoxin domain-containing protein [Microtetraspora niveoalba]